MKYVIVKDDKGNVVGKDVYAGDESKIVIGPLSTAVDQMTFDATQLTVKVTPEQTAWQTAKVSGMDAALTFLGKRFGLE